MSEKLYPERLDTIVRLAEENELAAMALSVYLSPAAQHINSLELYMRTASVSVDACMPQVTRDVANIIAAGGSMDAAEQVHPGKAADSRAAESYRLLQAANASAKDEETQLEYVRSALQALTDKNIHSIKRSIHDAFLSYGPRSHVATGMIKKWSDIGTMTRAYIKVRTQETITVRGITATLDTARTDLQPIVGMNEIQAIPKAIAGRIGAQITALAGMPARLTAVFGRLQNVSSNYETAGQILQYNPPEHFPAGLHGVHGSIGESLGGMAFSLTPDAMQSKLDTLQAAKDGFESTQGLVDTAHQQKEEAVGHITAGNGLLHDYTARGA